MLRTTLTLLTSLALAACGSDKASESATDTAEAGSDTAADGGDGARGDCDEYLVCIAAAMPGSSEQAQMAYGPDGPCWNSSPEIKNGCLSACTAGLMTLALTYPDEPACGGSGSGSTTAPTSSTTGSPMTTTDASTSSTSTSEPVTSGDPTGDVTNDPSFTSDPSETTDPDPSQTTEPDPSDTAGGYGACGWDDANNWYGCGGVPGLEDPEGISPIACPANIQRGGPCSDQDGPVTGAGCCTGNGDNYYCARGSIYSESCGF